VSGGRELTDLLGKTRIYNRPSPRTKWLAVTRPASMHLALSQAGSKACSPNSPNSTVLPRVACPRILPRWFFRNLTRLGISAIARLLFGQVISLVDPHLDADVALCSFGFRKAVADLRT